MNDAAACLAAAVMGAAAGCLMRRRVRRVHPAKWANAIPLAAIIFSLLLFARYGLTLLYIKGILFGVLLFEVSCRDIRTHEIDDFLHVMLFLTAWIGVGREDLSGMLLGALCIPLPFLLAAVVSPGAVGGGDIKLMAACGFLLGFSRGLLALLAGLLPSVTVTPILHRIRKTGRNAPFALGPYLAAGSLLAYFV